MVAATDDLSDPVCEGVYERLREAARTVPAACRPTKVMYGCFKTPARVFRDPGRGLFSGPGAAVLQ